MGDGLDVGSYAIWGWRNLSVANKKPAKASCPGGVIFWERSTGDASMAVNAAAARLSLPHQSFHQDLPWSVMLCVRYLLLG